MKAIKVIGAGLAGSEAAWQIAKRGLPVQLYEMRPLSPTPAHQTGLFAELVCSNSLGSQLPTTAGGLLKKELAYFDSLILKAAQASSVPAGGALAVDRQQFAQKVTDTLQASPFIEVIREEYTELPAGIAIIATGPLSSAAMNESLAKITKSKNLFFYDAAAPIVTGESIDFQQGFWAARYGQGSADYFNCPLTKEEYLLFWEALTKAEVAPLHESESQLGDLPVFESCVPIEVTAQRGQDALRYGPLRPVGLTDKQGKRPYAVLQLRLEDTAGSLFNLVGCQTRLKWGEQKRVFQMVPALRRAEFVRYGVMHRNTFLNSPQVLKPSFQFRQKPQLFLAGQITGVEGYVESTASGLVAGINATRLWRGLQPLALPPVTMLGSLANYISQTTTTDFQPMNANFGLLPPIKPPIRNKKARRQAYTERSLQALSEIDIT